MQAPWLAPATSTRTALERVLDRVPDREPVAVPAVWLDLREHADAAARSTGLARSLRDALARPGRLDRRLPGDPLIIHDLGAGTGSMMRWLAPRLTGEQHWVLHDTDPTLLGRATRPAGDGRPHRPTSADGRPVLVTAARGDVTRLDRPALGGADVITISALLDLLTTAELRRLVAACADALCPVLATLTVTGRVDLAPPDRLDEDLRRAFNDHQRRRVGRDRLLGPDAVSAAVSVFREHGYTVRDAPSPWRLAAADAALATGWLEGWIAPAVEVRPDLDGPAADYLHRRRDQAAHGELTVAVHHMDVLALPGTR